MMAIVFGGVRQLLGADLAHSADMQNWRVELLQRDPYYGLVSVEGSESVAVSRLGRRSWRAVFQGVTRAFGSQWELGCFLNDVFDGRITDGDY
jgi:hypothetical protein|nr:MAG TPA: hypothetical protein [Bacteriophage sp.]